MTPDERGQLRDAAIAAIAAIPPSTAVERVLARWTLQTSNSFRRIGCLGDGDVVCGTKHPIDGHPDLLARPGVLDYIVAAQPRVVIGLLDDLDATEEKLRQARVVCDRVEDIEKKLVSMAEVLATISTAVVQLADPTSDPETVARARMIIEELATAARKEAGA